MNTQDYVVECISYDNAIPWLLEKHYAKRIPSISYSFGLFRKQVLVGVCTFGKPASHTLCEGICGEDYSPIVFELNRLVLDNNIKNEASWFISQCFKLLPKPMILVSYADSSQNHCGYIYQATNWIYTGISAKRTEWVISGLEHMHSKSISDMTTNGPGRIDRLKEKYGDDLYYRDRPRKHRYIYFIGDKRQRKELKRKLKYTVKPYPKTDVKHYDTSAKIVTQMRLI